MAGMFKKILGTGASIMTGGLYNPYGGGSDMLLGEKPQTGGFGTIPLDPELVAMQKRARALQGEGIDYFKESQNINPEEIANKQVQDEIKAAQGGFSDAIRRTREMMARRGMGSSSLANRAEVGQGAALSEKTQNLQASLPERIRALREQRAQNYLNASGKVLTDQGARPSTYSYDAQDMSRRGGLLPGIIQGAAGVAGKAVGSK